MSAKAPKILIVDDEPQIRTLLRRALARAGYRVTEAGNGREALAAKRIDRPELILLDLGLPDRDGLELVTTLKQAPGCRLIVVSAREQTEEKVAALDLGADDYVTKPFDVDELLARVRASLRLQLASEAERARLVVGELEIDLALRTVSRSGQEVHLTPKEWLVLAELAKAPGRVITHRQLLRSGWGPAQEEQTEYLRVVMRALRQKLEADPASPRLLINEPGIGYRLVAG
jgi:two-component system KDP operon response regulator KdpE